MGQYGLGTRNARGERLVEFCVNNRLVITNTFFKNPKRRIYTWKQPGDINRYQIDFILVKERFRNQVKDCKCFPGADIDSDHNLVVMKCELKFKKLEKSNTKPRLDLKKLKEERIQEQYARKTEEVIKEIDEDINEEWGAIKLSLENASKVVIGKEERKVKKPWITEEILELMEERRKRKNSRNEEDQTKYKQLRNQINRKCKKAKEEYINKHCEDIEQEIKRGKLDVAYRKVKMHFGRKSGKANALKDEQGKEPSNSKEKAQIWKRYLDRLYGGHGLTEELETPEEVNKDDEGESILREEFDQALKDMKGNKAAGIDEIPIELIKYAGARVKDRLFRLVCRIYDEGKIPKDFQKSVIIPIPKKINADRCEYYRTISLLPHASKILTRIIYRRIESRIDEQLEDDQFGFRRNRGTREAILSLKLIIEERMRVGKSTCIAFVDLEKAFDNVEWNKMFDILKKTGLKYKDRRVIYNLYIDQTAVVRVDNEEGESKIGKGVRQGCSLSPIIFNLYIEEAIRQVKEGPQIGVKIQGEKIAMIRFADDIAILAENGKNLQDTLYHMKEVMSEFSMKINKKKTKVMKCAKLDDKRKMNVQLEGVRLDEVEEFCYLGSIIKKDNRSKRDIKSRIAQAKKAFAEKRNLLTSTIEISIRKRFLKTYVWSVALYGCETWTIGKEEKRRIEAFEMWCYRRMLKVSWTEKTTNEEILNRVQETRSIWKTLTRRRDRMIGHILRHGGLTQMVVEGRAEGKRTRGRPRQTYINQIVEDVGVNTFKEMKELAQDRPRWRAVSNQS